MSEDYEVASAVQAKKQLGQPVGITPLHLVFVKEVQEELEKPENEENTREIFVLWKESARDNVERKGKNDIGERKEQGKGSTVKRKEEQEQSCQKLEARDNEGAKRRKFEKPPKAESRKVQSVTDKGKRPPEQSKKEVTRQEEQEAGCDKDKKARTEREHNSS